jgi:hypothetical protein
VGCLGSKQSSVAENIIQELALRLKLQRACPLTPIHIEGDQNAISDVPSWSFGSNPTWKCNMDAKLLTLFNPLFPLPEKKSWTVFRLNCEVVMRVTSTLWTRPFKLAEWRQLPKVRRHVGNIGAPTSDYWGWICTLTTHPSKPGYNASRDLPRGCNPDSLDRDDKFRVLRSLKQSQLLARQSCWPTTIIPQR